MLFRSFHRSFIGGVVVIGAFVEEIGSVATCHAESVSESRRDVKLSMSLFRQFECLPPAERRRRFAQIDRDVEDRAADDLNQLALRLVELVMQAADRTKGGAGEIVLDEFEPQSCLAKTFLLIGLEEEPAAVGENFRFDQQKAGEVGRSEERRVGKECRL